MHEGGARPALALEALASARRSLLLAAAVLVPLSLCAAVPLCASSHGDAPAIAGMPEVAAADFYMFRSYEPGRDGFVTFLADFNPMQDPFGGPTYFPLRQGAFYDIHVDSTGDGVEDLTFRFTFKNALPLGGLGLGVPVPFPTGEVVPVAIVAVAPFGPGTPPPPPPGIALNWLRSYTGRVLRGPASHPTSGGFLTNTGGGARLAIPFDDIGGNTIPGDDAYAAHFLDSGTMPSAAALPHLLVASAAVGLAEKNLFEASQPKDDGQFKVFVQKPSVPVGIQIVTCLPPAPGPCVTPPTNIPRQDLVGFYLEGLPGLNQDNSGAEVVRLNVNTPPLPAAEQSNLGFLGGDRAGWPNGRRPGDDVVDITLRVLEGALCYKNLGLCTPADAPLPFGQAPFTDQTWVDATQFSSAFPYLNSPIPGSPNPARVFNAALTGAASAVGSTGACSGLLTPDQAQLAITCTHDLVGASIAEIVQGATVICAFTGAARPILNACPLTAGQVLALQQQKLAVIIAAGAAAISGKLQ